MLTDECGIVFAKAISSNSCLQKLDLSKNELTGKTGEPLANNLRNNYTLSKLNLEDNRISH